jgi:hypothetical protein
MTTATLHPMPVRAEPELSAARASLANASRALRDEMEHLEVVAAPAHRLGALSVELSTMDGEIAQLRNVYGQTLGTWIASGQHGERPQPPMRLGLLEARRPALARDVDAAEQMRPSAEAAHQRAAARVREAKQARDDAIAAVAIEAAADLAGSVWLEALNTTLKFESQLRGLAGLLTVAGNQGQQTAGNAAAHINNVIVETRRAASVPHDVASGRRLLDALTTNARASLEAT